MPPIAPADLPVSAPVSLFYSYAHEDEKLRADLERHLKILERSRLIQPWHDRSIIAGQPWDAEIDRHLRDAELVLLLLSSYFIGSDYILGSELRIAMQRQAEGLATVVPIMLRPVDLQPEDAQALPFVDLLAPQGLPRDLKPVTSWRSREEAWVEVAKGLRATVKRIRAARPLSVELPAPPATGPGEGLQAPLRAAPGPVSADGLRTERRAEPHHKPRADPLLKRVVDDFARELAAAQQSKGGARADARRVRRSALRLIDAPEQTRLLWVDDHPDNNLFEAAALAKLQIEVVALRSSDEALERLATDSEPFDLLITDWTREGEAAPAALHLLRRLRAAGHTLPVLVYHGAFEPALRQSRARIAQSAGAFGEAVLPDELLGLVLAAVVPAAGS